MTELHLDDRSWLLTDDDSRHRFGPAAAPLLTLNDEDADGCQWWCDLPEGWDAPEATTPIDDRPYGDGGYDGDTTYAPRTLTFGGQAAGFTACPDRPAAHRAWRRLLAVASSRYPVLYTATEDGGEWSLWLRATGRPNGPRWVDDRSFEWSFVMVAPDPFKFDAAEESLDRSAALPVAPTGALWPLHFPVAWGVGGTDTAIVVTNRGDEPAQARYTITGPADHPQVVNATTGAYARLERAIGPGDTVVIDTRSATVLLNGTSVFLDLSGGFPLIEPGDNTIRWSHQGPFNPDARLTVATASTRK